MSGRVGYEGWQTCLSQRERLKWTKARTHMALARVPIWLFGTRTHMVAARAPIWHGNAHPYVFGARTYMAVQRASSGYLSQRGASKAIWARSLRTRRGERRNIILLSVDLCATRPKVPSESE